MSNNVRNGTIGELEFYAAALKHGFSVSTPLIDIDGYDCILSTKKNNYRIQIKTSRSTLSDRTNETFRFATKLKSSKRPDFFVFYIPKIDVFYIVPTRSIAKEVKINPLNSKLKYHKYREAWHQFE